MSIPQQEPSVLSMVLVLPCFKKRVGRMKVQEKKVGHMKVQEKNTKKESWTHKSPRKRERERERK